MAHGVSSLGKGARTWKDKGSAVGAHVLSAGLAGAVAAGAAWLLLTPVRTLAPNSVILALVVFALSWAALIDARIIKWRLPGRQVPATWRSRYGVTRAYAMYGALLGFGLATHVNYAVVLGVFAVAGCLLPLGSALVAGVLFGIGRSATVGAAALNVPLADAFLFRGRWASRGWHGAASLLGLLLAASVVIT